jgi:hypothetical protein
MRLSSQAKVPRAVSVLRRLPEGGQYERPFLTSWPDYKPDPNTAYGYEDAKVTPPIPSPAAIQRMEEVLAWLQLAPLAQRGAFCGVLQRLWCWTACWPRRHHSSANGNVFCGFAHRLIRVAGNRDANVPRVPLFGGQTGRKLVTGGDDMV